MSNAKTVKEIMTSKVELVKPEARLTEIATKMQASDCGSVLIGENDRLVGIVTDRDIILRAVAKGLNPADVTAKQIMSTKVLYCAEDDGIDAVAENMARAQVRRLVVLNSQKRMVGIVSLGDIAAAEAKAIGAAFGAICKGSMKKAA